MRGSAGEGVDGLSAESIIELAKAYDAHEAVDGVGDTFRRRARILQSMWRSARGYEAGEHRGRRLGSRLLMPWAQTSLANYLTDTVRSVVRAEVLDPRRSVGKLYGKPRIFCDLLSSQPLCFNLFGELQQDLPLATDVLRDITERRVAEVTAIEFEHSPGRGDPDYLGDRSAFDIYVEFLTPAGGSGFIGIEVKYHEDLKGKAAGHKALYDQRADEMGCFRPECRAVLHEMPLQQVWRDHLLAGRVRQKDDFEDGFFVFLYPRDNAFCVDAVDRYRACLTPTGTFDSWTLEQVAAAIKRHTAEPWIDLFVDRYLDFDKVEREIEVGVGDRKPQQSRRPDIHSGLFLHGGPHPGLSHDFRKPNERTNPMATITTTDFLADSTARCFRDVVESDPGLFERLIGFFDDATRQERMVKAVLRDRRPALAGVVVELEQQPWFDAHMRSTPDDDTKRLRRAIGVLVRIIIEMHGFRKTGRKGPLKGQSRWFGSAEMYEP